MSVSVGSVVTVKAFGRKLNALVLVLRSGEVSHLGKNGEPLATVAFIDPARETGVSANQATVAFIDPARETGVSANQAGYVPKVFVEHDVVHASHEFSEQYFKDKKVASPTKADVASHRGHYEYEEFVGDASGLISSLRSSLTVAQAKEGAANAEAGKQKARADLAESELKKAKEELAALKPKA